VVPVLYCAIQEFKLKAVSLKHIFNVER